MNDRMHMDESSPAIERPEIGLPKGTVELRAYSPSWPRLFSEERTRIRGAVGNRTLAIEHVGSTSVPGLAAKPIIDIAIAVVSFERSAELVEPLAAIGYDHYGEFGIPGRRFFVQGEPRTHHLHVVEIDSDEWRNHRYFRDTLRADVEARTAYESLKRELAARFASDREAYTAAKSGFIRGILSRRSQERTI